MRPYFDNLVTASLYLFCDYIVLKNTDAYQNTTGVLYPTTSKIQNLNSYNSPFRQWVSDFAITGANIPTGIYIGSTFVPKGLSGLKIDYTNGRAWISGTNHTNVSGSFAVKDFNVYYTTEPEEEILFNSKFKLRSDIPQQTTGLAENVKTFPSIFVKYTPGQNDPMQLGGQLQNTKMSARAIIIASSPYSLDAVCGVFRDYKHKYFPYFNPEQLPFDLYGDYKSGNYNYETLRSGSNTSERLVHIKNIYVSKLAEKLNLEINRSAFGAFVDFELEIGRSFSLP